MSKVILRTKSVSQNEFTAMGKMLKIGGINYCALYKVEQLILCSMFQFIVAGICAHLCRFLSKMLIIVYFNKHWLTLRTGRGEATTRMFSGSFSTEECG